MRTLLTLGLVVGLVSAQTADAKLKQTSKAKTAATKTVKKSTAVKTTTTKVTAEKAAAAPVMEATAPAAATSTTAAPATTTPVKSSKWSLAFYTENTANMDKVADGTLGQAGGEAIYSYNYPRVNYKASDKVTFSVLQEFDANLGLAETDTSDVTFYDTQFRFSHSGFADLPGGVKANGQLRLYVPTTQASQDAGQILYIRPLLTLSKPIDKLTLSYNLMPRFYIQQFKTKDAKDDAGNPIQKGNSYMRVHQWLGAEYAINDTISVAGSYGYYQGWWYSDPSVGVAAKRVEGVLADLYTDINATKWLSLSIGVQTEDPMGGEGAVMYGKGGSSATKTVFDARALEYKFAANISIPL